MKHVPWAEVVSLVTSTKLVVMQGYAQSLRNKYYYAFCSSYFNLPHCGLKRFVIYNVRLFSLSLLILDTMTSSIF